MSVQYILNNTYSYVENSKLNPALEVGSSLKAPIHYVEDLTISKTESGNMSLGAPVVEATQIEAPIAIIDTINTEEIIPKSGEGGIVNLLGTAQISGIVSPSIYVQGAGTTPEVVVKNSDDATQIILSGNGMFAHGVSCLTAVLGGSTVWGQEEAADGAITLKDINNNQTVFLNAGTGVVSAPTLESTKFSIPTITPSASQVLASLDNQGTLYWKDDNSGDVSQWSTFPAVQNVDMNNQSITSANSVNATTIDGATVKADLLITSNPLITELNVDTDLNMGIHSLNLSKITIPDLTPAAGQVLAASDTDGSLYWKNDNSGDVSQWATFPAINTVDISNNDITNVNEITTSTLKTSTIELSSLGTGIEVNNDLIFNGGVVSGLNNIKTKGVEFTSADNEMLSTLILSNTDELTSDATFKAPAFISQSLTVNNTFGNPILEVLGSDNTIISTTNADMSGFGVISCSQVRPIFSPQKVYYVAKNGNDSWVGNIQAPFLTIQKAIDTAELNYDGTYPIINIMEGNYEENLIITGKVIFKGTGASADSAGFGSAITGDVVINFSKGTNEDRFNQQVQFNGVYINGTFTDDVGSTIAHVLNLVNSYVYSSSNGHIINFNPSGVGITSSYNRLWFENCNVIATSTTSTNELITIGAGMMKARLTQFQNRGYASVIQFKGTASCDSITLCSMTNTAKQTLTDNVAPIVFITGSIASRVFTFGNCAFIYTDTDSKASNSQATAIFSQLPSIIIIQYNAFLLSGTTSANNVVVNTSPVSTTLFFSNSSGYTGTTPQAKNINGPKLSFQAVS